MTSLQDCILQEPRSGGQERNSREPAEGMLSHLLIRLRLAWKLYPHVESVAGKAGLTIQNKPRRSPGNCYWKVQSSCRCTVQSRSRQRSRPYSGPASNLAINTQEESRQRAHGDLGVTALHSRSVSKCADVTCVQLRLLTIRILSTSPLLASAVRTKTEWHIHTS
jgi:hypothetical protein